MNLVKIKRPKNAKHPYQFINKDNSSENARINIYDIIGETWWEDGITGKSFANELSTIDKNRALDVYISSNGGDVQDGTVIYNALLNHQGTVNVIIDSWAISIASVIAMAGDSVQMSPIGIMMMHKPSNGCYGNANNMRKNADILDKVESALTNAYTNKTNLTGEVIAQMLDDETWMTADDALKHGFIDSITEQTGSAIHNSFSVNNIAQYKNVPDSVVALLSTDENIDEDIPTVPKALDAAEIENKRVVDIMSQCNALGLNNMAMELIKNKTSTIDAGTILSHVKAGVDDNSQILNQHSHDLNTTTSLEDSWSNAMKIAQG